MIDPRHLTLSSRPDTPPRRLCRTAVPSVSASTKAAYYAVEAGSNSTRAESDWYLRWARGTTAYAYQIGHVWHCGTTRDVTCGSACVYQTVLTTCT
eukprot:1441505-Rhodomonas_salina.1